MIHRPKPYQRPFYADGLKPHVPQTPAKARREAERAHLAKRSPDA